MMFQWLIVFAAVAAARADYPCVCNQDSELEVLDASSDVANTIGTLAVNDCKELVTGVTLSIGWLAIAYQHKIGYIQSGTNIVPKQCSGSPPAGDKVSGSSSGTTGIPMTSTTGMMTSPSMMMSSSSMPVSSTMKTNPPVSIPTGSIISGNTKLCPVALQSFAAQDGGFLTQYDKSCYEVVPHRHSWTYAEQDCRSKGGHLIDITTAGEQDFIYKFLKAKYPHNVWIGLNDRQHEGTHEWVTGEAVTFTHWVSGASSNYHAITDCAYFRPQDGGYWHEGECSNGPLYIPHAYVCQYDVDTTVYGTAKPHGDGDKSLCPSSVQTHASTYYGVLGQYGNSCYELLPRYKVTWTHGEQLCQQHGGHLVHIDNADEQSFVQEFMTKHMPNHAVWIGLNDRLHENRFEWSSGNPVTYTNWANGHTNNFASHYQEDCALFIPYQNGHWDDVKCGQSSNFGDFGESHPIMCQYKKTSGGGAVVVG